ncbi:MAG TPA: hypothetical protein VKY74_03025, partial [Chloroflexia bacterium]|nr:hypothetical protein [Chloroflexia bacterium]
MFAKPHIRLPWASLGAALALLCLLGGGLYATRASGAGGPAAGKPGGPQLNAPAGGAAVFPAGDSPLAAGERRRLPNGTIVGRDDHHDLSPPLRDIPPVAALPRHEGPENPLPSHLAGGHVVDSVVQRFFGPLAMPAPSLTFDGISLATSGCGCLPPDTNGDVGPNDYVQTVNAAFAIWNKNGTALLTPRAINTLFSGFGGACQTQNAGDPLVNYDPLADRWVISQFTSAAPFAQCVAVSQTGDPTGSWYRYQFTESNTALYDYPKVGVWSDAYYLTANVFDNATQAFLYPSLLALDRSRMLQGLSATFQEFTPGNYYYAILPADVDGSTPPPAGAREPFLTVSGNNTQIHLWNLHVDFAAPASSHLDGPTNLTAAPWDPNLCGLAGNCIAQPGVATSAYLDSLADHTMFRLAYRRFGDGHEALVTNESVNVGGNQAGVRWYEIRDPNGAPAIYQQGTYAPDATSRWMGAAAMDRDGNLAVGYSASSTTVFPSVRYAGRLAGDPLGLLSQGEATLFAGTGAQNSGNRWGDYSDMTVDPSDDCTFWYTNEYLATTGTNWR